MSTGKQKLYKEKYSCYCFCLMKLTPQKDILKWLCPWDHTFPNNSIINPLQLQTHYHDYIINIENNSFNNNLKSPEISWHHSGYDHLTKVFYLWNHISFSEKEKTLYVWGYTSESVKIYLIEKLNFVRWKFHFPKHNKYVKSRHILLGTKLTKWSKLFINDSKIMLEDPQLLYIQ